MSAPGNVLPLVAPVIGKSALSAEASEDETGVLPLVLGLVIVILGMPVSGGTMVGNTS